ncbi:MAG: hypothetical protein JW768_16700 [Chitinispirillaceae bacterium]|nr:hypothetical protein [Chitinispirillaceae bacterium]
MSQKTAFLNSSLIVICLLFSAYFTVSYGQEKSDADALIESVAEKAGMKSLDGIIEIDYTFTAKSSRGKIKRQWQWFLETDDVIFAGTDPSGKKGTTTYSRKALAELEPDAKVHKIEAWFIHDLYWLLLPHFLSTDQQKRTTLEPSAVMPMSGRWATKITVDYYKPDPRRPGDKFELFVDSTNTIREWICYPYESHKPMTANKWDNYVQSGPLMLSLDRPAKGRSGAKVKISDVNVSTKGK